MKNTTVSLIWVIVGISSGFALTLVGFFTGVIPICNEGMPPLIISAGYIGCVCGVISSYYSRKEK